MQKSKIFWLLLGMFLLSAFSLYAQFAGGDGTAANPYKVATAQQLHNVRNYRNAHFEQTADINLGQAPWNQGAGWQAIGTNNNRFYGTYDGGGFTISNLYINRPGYSYQGLFGYLQGTLKNITLSDVSVNASGYCAALAGVNYTGTIQNCSSSGNIYASSTCSGGLVGLNSQGSIKASFSTCSVESMGDYSGVLLGMNAQGTLENCHSEGSLLGVNYNGGLVGYNYFGEITNSYSKSTVQSIGDYNGGLLGMNVQGSIQDSYSEGSLKGMNYNGGLIGYNEISEINGCYSKTDVEGLADYSGGLIGFNDESEVAESYSNGTLSGYYYNGGLIGYNSESIIEECFSLGSLMGQSYSGGLVGYNFQGQISNSYNKLSVNNSGSFSGGLVAFNEAGSILNCYSTGQVTGANDFGGLIGFDEAGIITNSYWDIQVSGQAQSAGGAGRYTAQMRYPYSGDTYVGWNWQSIWSPDRQISINHGYPILRKSVGDVADPLVAPVAAECIFPPDGAHSVVLNPVFSWFSPITIDVHNYAFGYKFYLGTNNPPTNICNAIDMGLLHTYQHSIDLDEDTLYYWKIVPYNDKGEPAYCPVWSFSTYKSTVNLIYPNGGESWIHGTTRTILWQKNVVPAPYTLYFSGNYGAEWHEIATVDGSLGYYHYQVPHVHSDGCLIKLVNNYDDSISAQSANTFGITFSENKPRLQLITPSDENTHLEIGQLYTIRWERRRLTGAVALDYSLNDGQSWIGIASGILGNYYLWTVPYDPNTQVRVRVRSVANPDIYDISDFSFYIGRIKLLNPMGGEQLTGDYSGSYKHLITWTTRAIPFINLYYSTNDGLSWEPIASYVEAALGEYLWTLPGVPSEQYRIRISNSQESAIHDISERFSLRNPIRILNANGGGFIVKDSLFRLRWKRQNIDDDTLIYWEYTENGSTWTRINQVAVPVTDDSLFWRLYFMNRGSIKLRAVEEETERVLTQSEDEVQLTENLFVLSQPNGGEIYEANSTQTITWDYSAGQNLRIYLSVDDGISWSQIEDNVPVSSLSFDWTVPDKQSHQCRIRLQDMNTEYMQIDSDLPFTIHPTAIQIASVDFYAEQTSGEMPLTVKFRSVIQSIPGTIDYLLWDFGDGATSNELHPSHIYTEEGVYSVSLTVTNDFGESISIVKADYIVVLPNAPRIVAIDGASVAFAPIYVNGSQATYSLMLKNIGTAPLIISAASITPTDSPFTIIEPSFRSNISVPPYGLVRFLIGFNPTIAGEYSATLSIESNAANMPVLEVPISGTCLSADELPAAVRGLIVNVIGSHARLDWQAVDNTIYNTPIQPDGYIVMYSESPYAAEQDFYFHSFVTDNSFTHRYIAQNRSSMFYRIVALVNNSDAALDYLRGLSGGRNHHKWAEVRATIHNLK